MEQGHEPLFGCMSLWSWFVPHLTEVNGETSRERNRLRP